MVVKLREAYGAVDTSATTELPSGQKDIVVKYESSPQATWEQAIARWKQGTEKTQLLAAMEPSVMEKEIFRLKPSTYEVKPGKPWVWDIICTMAASETFKKTLAMLVRSHFGSDHSICIEVCYVITPSKMDVVSIVLDRVAGALRIAGKRLRQHEIDQGLLQPLVDALTDVRAHVQERSLSTIKVPTCVKDRVPDIAQGLALQEVVSVQLGRNIHSLGVALPHIQPDGRKKIGDFKKRRDKAAHRGFGGFTTKLERLPVRATGPTRSQPDSQIADPVHTVVPLRRGLRTEHHSDHLAHVETPAPDDVTTDGEDGIASSFPDLCSRARPFICARFAITICILALFTCFVLGL